MREMILNLALASRSPTTHFLKLLDSIFFIGGM